MQTHRMIIDRRVVELDADLLKGASDERGASYSLFYQMTRLTADRGCLFHDDRLDAWAMAIAWFQEQAAQDQTIRRDARLQETIESEVADWRGHVVLTPDRAAMGMSLEMARMADAGSGGLSWI
jgi:hypothetical protein